MVEGGNTVWKMRAVEQRSLPSYACFWSGEVVLFRRHLCTYPSILPILALSLSEGAALLVMQEPTVNQSEGGSFGSVWMNSRNLTAPLRNATSFTGELDVALSARDSANEREKIELRGEREGR